MVSDCFSLVTYVTMVFTYGLYVQKAVSYFKKSSISNMLAYRIIQIVGVLLILIFIVGGFGEKVDILISLPSLILLVISVVLIVKATSQHQEDKLDFAFSKDENKFLTTHGAYALIRHPIYTSYTIGWLGGLLFTQLISSIPMIIVLIGLYVFAIEKEEAGFLKSEYAEEYTDYKSRTYRMIPLIY